MIRILAADGIEKSAAAKLKSLGYELTEQYFEPEELAEQVKKYDVLVVRSATKVRERVIDAAAEAGRLKLIIRGGVGVDNIDVDYACSKGIEVRNTPKASSDSVAELTIAHLFTLARHLHEANRTMHEGKWEKKKYEGIELAGKTLGLIGLGRIGRSVATKASALGMNILYTNLHGPSPQNEAFQYVSMGEILANSDFISLHVPKTDAPLITAKEIEQMKDGAYIVNTARASLIDNGDLIAALDSGKLAGVAVDVYPEEPPKDGRLIAQAKLSLTPHIGASTVEAQERIGEEVVSLIEEKFC
jgi:D-3-phosphoglycerate dehydrogenase